MPPLCACGCGNPVRMRYGQWNTYLKGHGKKRGRHVVDAESGCWVWQGQLNDAGYGLVSVHKKRGRVHIRNWEKIHGSVPDGLELDHTCRNRACVNPAHLEAVTHAENMRRGANPVINKEQVREIRRLLATGMIHRHIADRIGVGRWIVSDISRGHTWVGVD